MTINDSNRDYINTILPDEMMQEENFQSLDNALPITRFDYIMKGKASLTVKYQDGSECFYMQRLVKDVPVLSEYVNKNGYLTYPRSSKFLFDLLKFFVPVLIGGVCIYYRKKTKRDYKQ